MISLVSIRDLQAEQLRELHECEGQIVRIVPGMIHLAWHQSLAGALESLHDMASRHVARLTTLLSASSHDASDQVNAAVDGMVAEIAGSLWTEEPHEVLDAAMVIELRRLVHLTMAGCTTLIALAEAMNDMAVARPVREMLEEVIDVEHQLALIARNEVNPDGALAGVPDEARRLGVGLEWTDFST